MYKRVLSVLLVVFLIAALPLFARAQSDEDYTDAGELTLGTVVIDGEEYSFVYSPAVALNKGLAASLAKKLGNSGELISSVRFDYEVLDRQGIFVICGESGTPEYLAAASTLERSFLSAFPEYSVFECTESRFDDSVVEDESLELAPGRSKATVLLEVEPEYVEREINGEMYQVLMVGSKLYSYTVSCVTVELGNDDAAVQIEPDDDSVEETESTDATTTATESTATTTTATTTTTTIAVTATTTTTTAAATTTTTTSAKDKTTTTAAKTSATTTAASATAGITTTTAAGFSSHEIELDETGYVVTRLMNLRVRSTPSLSAEVIATLPKGTEVSVVGMVGMDWYKIRMADGTIGYCSTAYIEVK